MGILRKLGDIILGLVLTLLGIVVFMLFSIGVMCMIPIITTLLGV